MYVDKNGHKRDERSNESMARLANSSALIKSLEEETAIVRYVEDDNLVSLHHVVSSEMDDGGETVGRTEGDTGYF